MKGFPFRKFFNIHVRGEIYIDPIKNDKNWDF
jgi:hypothetical protein